MGRNGLDEEFEIADAPSTFKADVWQHFPISGKDNVEKETDKHKTICKYCRYGQLHYEKYIKHEKPFGTSPPSKAPNTTTNYLEEKASAKARGLWKSLQDSVRAEEITRCIGEYIVKDIFCGRQRGISKVNEHAGAQKHHSVTAIFYSHSATSFVPNDKS